MDDTGLQKSQSIENISYQPNGPQNIGAKIKHHISGESQAYWKKYRI